MTDVPDCAPSCAPIGVFDSGVGGLSVLRALRARLPQEDFIYYADRAWCPYGERSREEIVQRSFHISDTLLARGVKLIVVACNTATIAAVEALRATYPLPFIGMEPAVKPAVTLTRSGVVGVLATGAALAGDKFHRLIADHAGGVRVITQPCPGLVEQIEQGELTSVATRELLQRYTAPLLAAGADVLVLGCTHYPFIRPLLAEVVGPCVQLIDTGAAVARHAERVLQRESLLCAQSAGTGVEWLCSGDADEFARLRENLMRAPLPLE